MAATLFLSTEDIQGLATMAEIVDAVADGYRQRGLGAPAAPRTMLTESEPRCKVTAYVAILPETGAMGGYTYAAGGASGAFFMTPLFDINGEALALLDGGWMNPYKTGAAGAVGIDALARPDATKVALIGSGRQARGQLLGAAEVRDLERVSVYSPTPSNRQAFATEFDDRLEASVEAVDSSDEAVATADIVITATKASDPVFDGDAIQPGTHITIMGQYQPGIREVDVETISRSTYVPDLRDRAFQDAGSFLHALETGAVTEGHIHAELGEVVAGTATGRSSPDEITLFDSGGTAIETVAAAHLFYERAKAEGLGTPIDLRSSDEYRPGP